jgi:hypothetical protein
MRSIHSYLHDELSRQSYDLVFYDDGSGEVADYVTVEETSDEVRFVFYHAKASHGEKAGERVADVYEVCGQAVKSIRWTLSARTLVQRLLSRSKDRESERMVVGTRNNLKDLLESIARKKIAFEIVIVQPGISKSTMGPDNIALPLASADFFITTSGGFENLRVMGSQ